MSVVTVIPFLELRLAEDYHSSIWHDINAEFYFLFPSHDTKSDDTSPLEW